ncbi:MAG: YdcF family protein [Acidipropionibacterium sp.]|nr:YdcF family protein [Acidipropionibacterium sp.]
MGSNRRSNGRGRWVRRGIVTAASLAGAALIGPWALAEGLSVGRIHEVDDTPKEDVAIVFGAAVRPDGTPSGYLQGRLDAAADLYRNGTVRAILVSGDNGTEHYNEPDNMKRYLVDDRGVPSVKVVTDYAGFDTYDTCVRARKIFGVTSAVVVTQDYHLARAVATCRMTGLDVQGTADHPPRGRIWWYGWSREFGARLKMIGDVVSRRTPVLGAPEDGVAKALSAR